MTNLDVAAAIFFVLSTIGLIWSLVDVRKCRARR